MNKEKCPYYGVYDEPSVNMGKLRDLKYCQQCCYVFESAWNTLALQGIAIMLAGVGMVVFGVWEIYKILHYFGVL